MMYDPVFGLVAVQQPVFVIGQPAVVIQQPSNVHVAPRCQCNLNGHQCSMAGAIQAQNGKTYCSHDHMFRAMGYVNGNQGNSNNNSISLTVGNSTSQPVRCGNKINGCVRHANAKYDGCCSRQCQEWRDDRLVVNAIKKNLGVYRDPY